MPGRVTLRKLIHKPVIHHLENADGEERHAATEPAHNLQPTYYVGEEAPQRLHLLYSAIQRRHGKWVVAYGKDKGMRTCFKKLSHKFDELKRLGLEVDEVEYICAHKATYGDSLRPQHLISWCSLGIYQSYLSEKRASHVEVSQAEQDAFDIEMVDYLMRLRGESREQVTALLEGCDLL